MSNYWYDKTKDFQRFATLKEEITTDVLVIGGGIAGLLTAWHLMKSGKKVVLLEKNHIATGATGASTGFITRPIDTTYSYVLEKHGRESTQKYVDALKTSQEQLIDLIMREKIMCDMKPAVSHYIGFQKKDPVLEEEWGTIATLDRDTKRKKSDQPWYADEIAFSREASLDLRAFSLGLANKIVKSAGRIYEESPVISIEKSNDLYLAATPLGTISTAKIVVATGAIDPTLFPELSGITEEKITHVAIVKTSKLPITHDQYWDTNKPYYYFRALDRTTLMLGGLDHDPADKIADPSARLVAYIEKLMPGKYTVLNEWSGSLFIAPDNLPLIFEHPEKAGIYCITGFAGVGIVPSMLASIEIMNMIAGEASNLREFLSLSRTGFVLGKKNKVALPAQQKANAEGFVPVATRDQLSPGKTLCVSLSGQEILLAQVDDRYFAIDNTCTHANGRLCDGELSGTTIECPLHQSTFDVTTGVVLRAPATRPVKTYSVKVVNNSIMIQIPRSATLSKEKSTVQDGEKTEKKPSYWRLSLAVASIAFVFWVLQFCYQYFVLIPGELGGSLVRSFALAGATLIACALFSSAIFRQYPALATHWRVRRYLGVSGFVLIFGHFISVLNFLFGFDIKSVYWSLNPLENPIVFGSFAFWCFMIMAATSTDWIVDRLTYRRWKILHRIAYFAWMSAVFHFIFINPALLQNPAGYLLLAMTSLVLLGQLYWWIRIAGRKKFITWGGLIGAVIIALYFIIGSLGYQAYLAPKVARKEATIESDVAKMKEYVQAVKEQNVILTMPEEPPAPELLTKQETLKSGSFENLHYMTSGSAQITQKDGKFYLVFGADFITPDGPDLRIYLTKNSNPTQRSDIYFGADLGKLKNLEGVQMYELPVGLNINEYNSVTIHCKAFNVPWSWARLQ